MALHPGWAKVSYIPVFAVLPFFCLSIVMRVLYSVDHPSVTVDIQLPPRVAAPEAARRAAADSVTVDVRYDGATCVDGRQVAFDDLTASVHEALLSTPHSTRTVVIRGSGALRYAAVMRLVDGIRAAGVRTIGFEIGDDATDVAQSPARAPQG